MGKKDKKVKKEKKGGKRMTKKQLVEKLTDLIQLNAPESVSLKRIYAELKLNTHPLKMLCLDILQDMLTDDFICEPEKGRYKLKNPDQIVTGTFQRKSNGKNSLLPEDGSTPIFVAERNSAHAMNNDKVRVALFARRKNREREGEVIEILERANDTFVGRLKVDRHYAFLLTESRTLANDIFIPKERLKGAKDGDKVVVRVAEWPDDAKNPIGQVIDVLGRAGDNTTEMHAILAEYGLPYSYPENVEHAAEQIPAEISAEDLAEREDFRDVLTFTIDPKDLQIDTYRSSGAGGQHVNKTESAIRITHLPTGTVVECQDERSQYKNKDRAMKILASRLYAAESARQSAERSAERRSQVGTGMRNERIRTYNFPQGRVTDHRIGLTLYKLNQVLDGDLDEIIDALTLADQAEKLRASVEEA